VETVAVWEDGVVHAKIFEDFDDGEGSAGEDALEGVLRWVEEADVLVHVEDVAMGEALDIFVQGD